MKTTKKGIYWRNGNLVIDHFVEGVRIYRTLDGNTNMKLAERVLAKMVNEVVEGTYFPGKSKSSLTVWDVLKDYKDQKIDPKIRRYEAEGLVRKVRQLKNLKYPMNQLADYFGKMPVHELNHSVLEVRKEKRMSERTRTGKLVGGRSVNVEFGLLNRALNWAVKATKKLRENPIKGFVKAEENEPSKRAFAEDEWLRFYDALSPRHKDLFLVIYESGARPSEILDLERGWVDLFKRQIHLPARITKTLKSRSIPMSDELFEVLKNRTHYGEYVFPSPETGRPYRSMQRVFERAILKAGLANKGLTIYSCRRARLTAWNEVDPVAAMKAAGHELNSNVHYRNYVTVSDKRLNSLVTEVA